MVWSSMQNRDTKRQKKGFSHDAFLYPEATKKAVDGQNND